MRHPFDGLNSLPGEQPSRRSVLGTLAGTAAGLLGLGGVAAAQQVKIQVQVVRPSTTLALGEEGGPMPPAAAVTTEPFGEEAGKVVSRAVPGLEDGVKPAPATEAKNEAGGPTTQAVNEEGAAATTKALNEEAGRVTAALREGGAVTRALAETGGPIVPVQPNTTELKEPQLVVLWKDMADKDAAKGVQACAVLYGSKNAIKFLEQNLTVEKYRLPQADAQTVAKLIGNLDSDDFATREKAETELAKLGPAVSAALEKAIQQTKSVEQKMRLERLLEAAKNQPGLTQAKRGLEVLVALRTPEAKELLRKLAKGNADEWLTQTARQALDRASK